MTDTNTASDQFTQTASTGGTVKDENLTIRGHLDPDKHWIGETLPAPSDQETTYGGIKTSAGTSPFPARANHSHDHRTTFGVYASGGLTVPPGQAFISNLSFSAGKNTLAPGSSQVVQFPLEGIWQTHFSWYATRDIGGNFTGEMNVVFYYTNGAYGRPVFRMSTFDIPGSVWGFAIDSAHYNYTDSSTNVQVAIQHNDVSNWTVSTQYLEVRRLYSYGSA
jgi:hypothetical protein